MLVKAVCVVGLLFLLNYVDANKCPRCGSKLQLRAGFDDDDPMLKRCFGQALLRSKPLQKPPLNLPLHGCSFKGPCFRTTAIVKPAVIPRPIYTQPDCKTGVGTKDSDLATAAAVASGMLTQLSTANCLNTAPVNLGPSIDISKAYQQALAGAKPTVPADAVSLSLAYKTYQDSCNRKVSEDGLAYGFRKLPLEKTKSPKPCISPISEPSLYSLNGEIVELKPPSEELCGDSLSAEAMDELVDLACDTELNDVSLIKRPTLTDLGYTPTQVKKESFINIAPQCQDRIPAPAKEEREKPECPESGTIFLPPLTIEGFKPGDVIYKDCVTSELKETPPSCATTCESQAEVVRSIPVPSCGCQLR